MSTEPSKRLVTYVRTLLMATGAYTLDQINGRAPGLAAELLELVGDDLRTDKATTAAEAKAIVYAAKAIFDGARSHPQDGWTVDEKTVHAMRLLLRPDQRVDYAKCEHPTEGIRPISYEHVVSGGLSKVADWCGGCGAVRTWREWQLPHAVALAGPRTNAPKVVKP